MSNDAELVKSIVLSNTNLKRQTRSLSRGRVTSVRPASASLLEERSSEFEAKTNSRAFDDGLFETCSSSKESRGRLRGRVQYRERQHAVQPRSQSLVVSENQQNISSNNQLLPCTLSKVKISETENPRKQVTFLPTWQVLPASPKIQLLSYRDFKKPERNLNTQKSR